MSRLHFFSRKLYGKFLLTQEEFSGISHVVPLIVQPERHGMFSAACMTAEDERDVALILAAMRMATLDRQ